MSHSAATVRWFLHIASPRGFVVDGYRDEAVGMRAENSEGKVAITEVTLRPEAVFGGEKVPPPAAIEAIHHEAHEECSNASSVRTTPTCEPVLC